uniref:hypothetical protein n=1 Tax=Bacillus altitudinis TaxID=293387 RepID=UPI001C92E2A7
ITSSTKNYNKHSFTLLLFTATHSTFLHYLTKILNTPPSPTPFTYSSSPPTIQIHSPTSIIQSTKQNLFNLN